MQPERKARGFHRNELREKAPFSDGKEGKINLGECRGRAHVAL